MILKKAMQKCVAFFLLGVKLFENNTCNVLHFMFTFDEQTKKAGAGCKTPQRKMATQSEKFIQKQQKVTKGILEAFATQFPHLSDEQKEAEPEFETIWPWSVFDTIKTFHREFDVKLKLTTGKVLSITEVTL